MADTVDARGGGEDQTDAFGQSGKSGRVEPPVMRESEFVSDIYNMNHLSRGTAVIINNKEFHPRTGMGVRTGTDIDCDAMYDLLTKLHFENIIVLTDSSVKEMKSELVKISKEDHTDNDCFLCVILSHGEEGYIFGRDDKISLDELIYPFKGPNCPSLAGKPKLFFIQACRGTELDKGVEVCDAGGETMEVEEEVVSRRIPTEADFLMAYSVVPGYFAWRNSSRGSWFIQAIVHVFNKHWDTLDILTMMTRVNKAVAYDFESNASKEFMNRKKQIPCITSMLTKDLFFRRTK